MHEPLPLIERLLAANCTFDLLQALRVQAMRTIAGDFSLTDGLLLY
jgi:hypothetical protein